MTKQQEIREARLRWELRHVGADLDAVLASGGHPSSELLAVAAAVEAGAQAHLADIS
jgi:hypothetical protein